MSTQLHPIPSYLNDFLEYCEVEKGLSATTSKNYANFLSNFFSWLKQQKIETITPSDFNESLVWKYRLWLSHRPSAVKKQTRGLASSTQIRYLIALRALLSYFHEKNIPTLPLEKIKLPKDSRVRQVKFLTLEQVEKLLAIIPVQTIQGLRDRAILETLFSTGLRIAELVAIDCKQLEGIEDIARQDFELSITGKGGYPRTVYFSARTLHWLRNYLNARRDDEKPLFIRTSGPKNASKRLGVRSIELLIQNYSKIAGIPLLATPHTFRHSFATDLLNQGVDIRTVQEFLGHRNIATTQVYTHVTNKQLREIHKKFHGKKSL